ncbi:MAG: carbon-nitrogen hydrolase family protein [Dehalococcoidia bacterium]
MKVKVAAVQSESIYGEEEYKNAERALAYLEEAARTGAQLICFPEGYPGPAHGPLDSGRKLPAPPIEMLRQKTKELGVYVAASNVEAHPTIPNAYYLCQKLISPKGEIVGDHRRVQPNEPDLNEYLFGGKRDFVAGDGCVVVETELGKIGLLICSELFVPELCRIEMLMGAEILVAPVNGTHTPIRNPRLPTNPLGDTWKCISRARAAENMVYVVVTQNMFVEGRKGVGHIAGPESMLAEQKGPGIFTAELDMDRLRWLRGKVWDWEVNDLLGGVEGQPPLGCRPAQHILRRPEVYQKLLEPLASDFDYWYFLKEKATVD